MKTMIILLFAVLTSVSVAGQNLTLIVKDVEHVDGSVYVAIYSSNQTFMKKPVHSGVLWKSSGSAMMRKESWELLRLKNAVLNSNGTLRWLFI